MAWFKLALIVSLLTATSVWAQNAEISVPESARFGVTNLEPGEHVIVGRLSVRRQFLGTRAEQPVKDILEFFSFEGTQLKFIVFIDSETQAQLLDRALSGYGIPVVMTAKIEAKQVGHDGINTRERLIANIVECKIVTPEAILVSAKDASYKEADLEEFKSALEPDVVSDGVAVDIGSFYAQSKDDRRGSGISLAGVSVFNPHSKTVLVEIKSVRIKQGAINEELFSNEMIRWEVAPAAWSDGIYEEGKNPKRRWVFPSTKEIELGKEIVVEVQIELNGKSVSIERTVTPK